METKLTLSLEKEIIEKAKIYAKSQETSLSHLVESYFYYITSERISDKSQKKSKSPITDNLLGSLDIGELNTDKLKEDYLLEIPVKTATHSGFILPPKSLFSTAVFI